MALAKSIDRIRDLGREDWRSEFALAERMFPKDLSKPEVQLNLQNNVTAQAAAINGTPHNVQMVVVSDLEFLGLKRHPAYTHRPGFVREVEQVPPELSGTLVRENENIVVTSASRARATAERRARIRARAIELVDTCQAKGNGQTGAAPAPIVEEPYLLRFPPHRRTVLQPKSRFLLSQPAGGGRLSLAVQ